MKQSNQWFQSLYNRLLPRTDDILARGRAGMIIAACLIITLACVILIATWIISGDLVWQTTVAAAAIMAILAGIGALARAGRVPLASWSVTILLTVLISVEAWSYGVGSASCAAFAIPIILAAATLGLWASLGIAGIGSSVTWLSALAETRNWYIPLMTPDDSHLTFNAPALTVIFMIIAIIAGSWTRYAAESSRHLTLIDKGTEMAGSSLAKKLGIKPGHRAIVLNPPPGHLMELGPLPEGVELAREPEGTFDFAHLFVKSGRCETWVRCYLRPIHRRGENNKRPIAEAQLPE